MYSAGAHVSDRRLGEAHSQIASAAEGFSKDSRFLKKNKKKPQVPDAAAHWQTASAEGFRMNK